jgi:hypothetical protein
LNVRGQGNFSGIIYYNNQTPITALNSTTLASSISTTANIQNLINDSSLKLNYLNVTGNLSLGSGQLSYDSVTNTYQYYNTSDWLTLRTTGPIPAGAVMSFNQETCPDGWILADGTSGTPDLRGIFIRGAGTSGTYKNANGAYYTATLGSVVLDMMQGHRHEIYMSSMIPDTSVVGGPTRIVGGMTSTGYTSKLNQANALAVEDGNGAPRTGNETAPVSIALTYIIKY